MDANKAVGYRASNNTPRSPVRPASRTTALPVPLFAVFLSPVGEERPAVVALSLPPGNPLPPRTWPGTLPRCGGIPSPSNNFNKGFGKWRIWGYKGINGGGAKYGLTQWICRFMGGETEAGWCEAITTLIWLPVYSWLGVMLAYRQEKSRGHTKVGLLKTCGYLRWDELYYGGEYQWLPNAYFFMEFYVGASTDVSEPWRIIVLWNHRRCSRHGDPRKAAASCLQKFLWTVRVCHDNVKLGHSEGSLYKKLQQNLRWVAHTNYALVNVRQQQTQSFFEIQ